MSILIFGFFEISFENARSRKRSWGVASFVRQPPDQGATRDFDGPGNG